MNNYDKLPLQMRKAARWLLWKSVQGDDASKKPRKFPFYADGSARRGELDSPDDIARLASFDTAQRAFETGAYTGLGFALGQDVTGQFWQGMKSSAGHTPLCLSVVHSKKMVNAAAVKSCIVAKSAAFTVGCPQVRVRQKVNKRQSLPCVRDTNYGS